MANQLRLKRLEVGDGRRLRVEVVGDGGRVVLVQVGSPNAGLLYDRWVRDAAARGLTLVAYDRPGYGASSAQPGRSVADCAADVRAISEALGFVRCAVWGFSGGGPHALACAALLDDLVAAVATIGSPAPVDAPGLDYLALLSDDARRDRELFDSDRAEWEREGWSSASRWWRGALRSSPRSGRRESHQAIARHFTVSSASGCIEQSALRWRRVTQAGPMTTSRSFAVLGI